MVLFAPILRKVHYPTCTQMLLAIILLWASNTLPPLVMHNMLKCTHMHYVSHLREKIITSLVVSGFSLNFIASVGGSISSHKNVSLIKVNFTCLNAFLPSKSLAMDAVWLTLVNGEMKEVRTTIPASANNLATSLIRRMFSSRSSGVKARFLFKPALCKLT